jgi:PhnB protein
MYIPDGFNTVTPYFFVSEAENFVAFLTTALGGIEKGRSLRPDGKIANAQVQIGTSTMMISEAGGRFQPMASAYYLFVENADESMKQALENGATLIMEVGDMPYGDRQGGVLDSFGNIWWISQRLVPEPYA